MHDINYSYVPIKLLKIGQVLFQKLNFWGYLYALRSKNNIRMHFKSQNTVLKKFPNNSKNQEKVFKPQICQK